MKSVATRLYVVIGIIVVAYGVGRLVQAAAEPPEVELPDWTVKDLPLQLGNWQGEDAEMDPIIAAATGACAIANRIYRDTAGRAVSLHFAMFEDPAEGVYHSPVNCYRASGWMKSNETREEIKVAEGLAIPVILTTWHKENEKVLVAYWYQLGRHVLHSRLDLGGIRWEMRGQPKWPVLTKVMLQVQVNDADEAKTAILDFGQKLSKWLDSPEHRKYLDQWGGV